MQEMKNRWIGNMAGRGVCLLPVAMASGIILYFSLASEPSPLPAIAMLGFSLAFAWRWRGYRWWAATALVTGFAVAGFLLAQFEAQRLNTRFLEREIGPVTVVGQVISAEPLASGARLTLQHLEVGGLSPFETPNRVRLTSRAKGTEVIRAGDWIEASAHLSPPSEPFVPGGFDFQRHAFFGEIGASGFSLGAPRIVREIAPAEIWPGFVIDHLRSGIARRILEANPGEAGAIAAALITGHRRAIPSEASAMMRDSGLAHLLAISGLHIGLVAGFVFFGVRAIAALIPRLALHYPIKKWAAGAALGAAFSYMLLAGASVPTERAFIMTGFVMIAIMIDRRAFTFRLLALAALAILAWRPHALLEPGFQMSFAAVAALVAAYEVLAPIFRRWFPANANVIRKTIGYVCGVATSTLVAGAATAPFALYHFQQTAVFGLPANLVAVPMTGLWILPSGFLAMLAMPLGLDGGPLSLMITGIETMLRVARTVSAIPNSVIHTSLMPAQVLLLAVTGGLWLCVARGWGRALGAVPLILMVTMTGMASPPALLASASGAVVLNTGQHKTMIVAPNARAGRFEREILTRASGSNLARVRMDEQLLCDTLGCRSAIKGLRVAVIWDEAALIEDCWATDVLVALVPVAHRFCPGPTHVIDRLDLQRMSADKSL